MDVRAGLDCAYLAVFGHCGEIGYNRKDCNWICYGLGCCSAPGIC
jgi:hypothetical protein